MVTQRMFQTLTHKGELLVASPLLQTPAVTSLSWLQTKMKGELLVTTKWNWQGILDILSGKVTNAGNTAAKKTNPSLRKRRLLGFQVAEVGDTVGYTAEEITRISSISLQGTCY